jgi:hypothetical protein
VNWSADEVALVPPPPPEVGALTVMSTVGGGVVLLAGDWTSISLSLTILQLAFVAEQPLTVLVPNWTEVALVKPLPRTTTAVLPKALP